ncbi:MAG: PEP-CTERM sorting domain-containing protein [Acidobacteria bacterium]|nr:PEP-CTERM sorting domain-containing protein [Acidobacteriota bacterium]
MARPSAVLVFVVAATVAQAADFSFYATMRAGRNGNGDWEQGLGGGVAASDVTTNFRWSNGNPHWRGGDLPQTFRIGYNAAANLAYLSIWDAVNAASTITFNNPGAALGPNSIWTLPAASFFVSAANRPAATSVNVEGLGFSPGVQVLSGSLPVSLGANRSAGSPAQQANLPAALVFQPGSSGGDWYISGTIRFSGLSPSGNGARGSQLQFMMNASGTDNPEPAAVVLIGLGLGAILFKRYRR